MSRARSFILQVGGVAKVRIFTRIFLAQFGPFPWDAVPQMPVEVVLLPSSWPINIYNLASWARSTIIPLLLIRHHEPIYPIAKCDGPQAEFLDELWLDPTVKTVPYSLSLADLWRKDAVTFAIGLADKVLSWFGGLQALPQRYYGRQEFVNWILRHQEKEGDWAGIVMPMACSIQALLLEGYKVPDSRIQDGLAAIERFAIEDTGGRRMQACVSPHWDTVLMIQALCDATPDVADKRLNLSANWAKSQQQFGHEGDWRILRPNIQAGGFSFEYNNSWYPDVDDTAATILALLKHDPTSVGSKRIFKAVTWILGMQNRDGGWATFDYSNDKLFLNNIPFSDMDALCDASTANIIGRVLEVFSLTVRLSSQHHVERALLDQIPASCDRAIHFLAVQQELNGAWFGRWGSNHIYGTSAALCGLANLSLDRRLDVQEMAEDAIE